MAHKTKEDRQREAFLRKRKFLPIKEQALIQVMQSRDCYASNYFRTAILDAANTLQRAYEEAGYPRAEAEGMVRCILKSGKTSGCLSGKSIEQSIDKALQ